MLPHLACLHFFGSHCYHLACIVLKYTIILWKATITHKACPFLISYISSLIYYHFSFHSVVQLCCCFSLLYICSIIHSTWNKSLWGTLQDSKIFRSVGFIVREMVIVLCCLYFTNYSYHLRMLLIVYVPGKSILKCRIVYYSLYGQYQKQKPWIECVFKIW